MHVIPSNSLHMRFDVNVATAPVSTAVVPHEEPEDEAIEPWAEPSTLDALTEKYNLEAKVPGKTAGTSLYVVFAKERSGETREIVEGQQYKLFLVTWSVQKLCYCFRGSSHQ